MSEEKPVTSVGHGLPSELQDLRKDEAARPLVKGKFTYVPGLSASRRVDPRITLGEAIAKDVPRVVTGKAALTNFQVDISTIKPDRSTDDRMSLTRTVGAKDGFALNIWQKGSDGTHRMVLFVTGMPNEEGELVLEVKSKDAKDKLPIYSVTTRPSQI